MSTPTLSQRLREIAANIPTRMSMNDQGWSPSDVAEMIRAIAAQAEAQEAQAIGEQTPVAKGEMWHPDPWLIGNVEAWKKEPPTQVGEDDDERRKQSRAELAKVMAANGWDIYGGSDYPWVVAMNYAWQEGWLDAFARSPMSSEARDKAIEWLGDAQHHLSNGRIGEVCIAVDQALSALRG